MDRALVLCEQHFGRTAGKTAAGLVRHSEKYQIVGILDSAHAGRDAGDVLDGAPRGIPIFLDLPSALKALPQPPEWLIVGVATIGGMLPLEFRPTVRAAIEAGINVIAGLHEYLSEDSEFRPLADKHGVKLLDIRRPPALAELHHYTNAVKDLEAVRLPVLGTDANCGKRTTAIELTKALNTAGIKTAFVATGQTGLLQGARYGIPIDAIQPDYMVGELEHAILAAYQQEHPKVIVIEGQGSLSHPAYVCGSRAIVSASRPSAVILQHAPKRQFRSYHTEELHLPSGTLEREIGLIKMFAECDVIGIALNHEGMTREEVSQTIADYEARFHRPTTDVLLFGARKLVGAVKQHFLI